MFTESIPEFEGKQIFVTGYGKQAEAHVGAFGESIRIRFARPGQVIDLWVVSRSWLGMQMTVILRRRTY